MTDLANWGCSSTQTLEGRHFVAPWTLQHAIDRLDNWLEWAESELCRDTLADFVDIRNSINKLLKGGSS